MNYDKNGRVIYTWAELNKLLRILKTEASVLAVFEAEKKGRNRARWLKRIHSRYRRLRTQREKRELARL